MGVFYRLAILMGLVLAGKVLASGWVTPIPRPLGDDGERIYSTSLAGDFMVAATAKEVLMVDISTGGVIKNLEPEIRLAPVAGNPVARRSAWGGAAKVWGSEYWVVCLSDYHLSQPGVNLGTVDTLSFHHLGGVHPTRVLDFEGGSIRAKYVSIRGDEVRFLDESVAQIRRFVMTTGEELPAVPLGMTISASSRIRAGFVGDYFAALGSTGLHVISLESGSHWTRPLSFVVSSSHLAFGAGCVAAVVYGEGGQTLRIIDIETGTVRVSQLVEDPSSSSSISTPLLWEDGRWGLWMKTGEYVQVFSGKLGKPGLGWARVIAGVGVWEIADVDEERILLKPDADDDLSWSHWVALPLPERKGMIHVTPCAESMEELVAEIVLDPPPATDLLLQVQLENGSAEEGLDFRHPSGGGGMIYPAGATSVELRIPLIEDLEVEDDEWFRIKVESPNGRVLWERNSVAPVIRGASFVEAIPESPFDPGPTAKVRDIALAGGRIVQTNTSSDAGVPAVVVKTLGGENWHASGSWALPPPNQGTIGKILASREGRVGISSDAHLSVYDPASDQVVMRVADSAAHSRVIRLSGDAVLFGEAFQCSVYDLSSGNLNYSSPFGTSGFTLAGDKVIEWINGEIRSTLLGAGKTTLFPARRFSPYIELYADSRWLLLVDRTKPLVAVADLETGSRPRYLELSEAGSLENGHVEDGKVYLIREVGDERIWVDVFDAEAGVQIGVLHSDFDAFRPEGNFEHIGLGGSRRYFRCFSMEGNETLLHTKTFPPDSPYVPTQHEILSRALLRSPYPAILELDPRREDDGVEVVLQLAEAVDEPLRLTLRPINAAKTVTWNKEESTAVLPAGQTRLAMGIALMDNGMGIADGSVPMEVTIEGSGGMERRRISQPVIETSVWSTADSPPVATTLTHRSAVVGGSWYGSVHPSGSSAASIIRHGDESFLINSPLPLASAGDFGSRMAGAGPWLAVSHRAWLTAAGAPKNGAVYVYRPELSTTPYLTIAGKSSIYGFGDALLVDGDQLWVGVPGNGRWPEDGTPAGYVLEYDLVRKRKVATYLPPAGMSVDFGMEVVASSEFVWILSSGPDEGVEFVHQYDRTTRVLLRSIELPPRSQSIYPGNRMMSAGSMLLVRQSGTSSGILGLDGSGMVRWLLPFSGLPGDMAILSGEILATASGYGIQFFELRGAEIPKRLGSCSVSGTRATRLIANSWELGYTDVTSVTPNQLHLLDLRTLPQLRPWVGYPDSFRPASFLMSGEALKVEWERRRPSIRLPSGVHLEAGRSMKLMFSTDLNEWEMTAFLNARGEWNLRPDLGAAWSLSRDSRKLVPVRSVKRGYFRFEESVNDGL